jgi:hypothetical protein
MKFYYVISNLNLPWSHHAYYYNVIFKVIKQDGVYSNSEVLFMPNEITVYETYDDAKLAILLR